MMTVGTDQREAPPTPVLLIGAGGVFVLGSVSATHRLLGLNRRGSESPPAPGKLAVMIIDVLVETWAEDVQFRRSQWARS